MFLTVFSSTMGVFGTEEEARFDKAYVVAPGYEL